MWTCACLAPCRGLAYHPGWRSGWSGTGLFGAWTLIVWENLLWLITALQSYESLVQYFNKAFQPFPFFWLTQTPDHWFQEDHWSVLWTAPGLVHSSHTKATVKTTLVFTVSTLILYLKPFGMPFLCELNIRFFFFCLQPEIKRDAIKHLHSTVSDAVLVVCTSCFAQFEVFPTLNTPALTYYGFSN